MMAWIMVLYRVQEEETTMCVESQKNDTKNTLCRFRVLCRLPPEQVYLKIWLRKWFVGWLARWLARHPVSDFCCYNVHKVNKLITYIFNIYINVLYA